jgi:hypothetical protein
LTKADIALHRKFREWNCRFSSRFVSIVAPWTTVPVNHETSSPGEYIDSHLMDGDRYCSNTTDRPENDSASIHPALSTARLRQFPSVDLQVRSFAQQDAYGDSGFVGVAKAVRSLGGNDSTILRLNYQRNTVDVGIAMATCPVCKSEAEEIEPGTFDGVWFRCLKHREFGVSDTALKTRKDAEPEQWKRALKKAIGGRRKTTENYRR